MPLHICRHVTVLGHRCNQGILADAHSIQEFRMLLDVQT